jgi:hypothetical protein
VIVNPGKGDTLAPSVVTMGNGTIAVPVYFSDRGPQLWANSGEVWVYSDQVALISCTELVEERRASPSPDKQNPM